MTDPKTNPADDAAKATLDDVRRVATLAHLELDAAEESRMLRDLNSILDYVAQIQAVDTTNVAPMSAGTPDNVAPPLTDSRSTLRPDTHVPSLDRAPVMAEAPETDGAFFKVPKVIER